MGSRVHPAAKFLPARRENMVQLARGRAFRVAPITNIRTPVLIRVKRVYRDRILLAALEMV